ncbi:MAG: UvrD-helicase domain-containing protein [Bryobacteraceae bacterium]|jgi:ATP-dependent exoDNAse (exonuclease V) beta subunit
MPEARRAPDAAQRERALDPARSFIVQAPAGSGKTELLIQRYLVLLARVEQPESVVAITFTRKAAGEMRRRVLDALASASGPAPDAPHEALTHRLARAVAARDAARLWRLSENPSRLNIRTIDSLSASLTGRMPWLSRLGAPPEVTADASALYAEAARRTVALLSGDALSPHLERVLLHLDNNASALEALLANMLARRDQWLRHLAGVQPAEARPVLEGSLRNVIGESLARLRAAVPAELAHEIVALAAHAARNVDAGDPIAACAGLVALPAAGVEEFEAWRGLAKLLLTDEGGWRKPGGVKRTIGFPPQYPLQKQWFQELLASLGEHEEFRLRLAEIPKLPPHAYDPQQWEALEAVVPVLLAAAAQLLLVFSERGQVDFTEVSLRALQALGEEDEPTDLGLAFDARIEHLLVDEFQDTSVTQFELLRRLTAGWQADDGRTLFAVGDPMQSIYRFREAEVGLFLRAAREGLPQVPLDPVQLTTNFRSEQGIVDWVNRVFPGVLAQADDVVRGAVRFAASEAVHGAGSEPAVSVHPFLAKDDNAEAARVVEIVRQARQRDSAARIAILVRARAHIPWILRALRDAGICYRAVEIDQLAEVAITEDLLALTRALLNPADRIAWLALLRAPWCGLTLDDLHALASDDPEGAIWNLMHDAERLAALSADGRARLLRVRAALAAALAHRGPSLRRWVEGVWMSLGGPASAVNPGDLETAQAFFDLLEGAEQGGDADTDALAGRMEGLFAAADPEAGESLQVMTMYKAKGLEFDIVILPGLDRWVRGDEPRLLAWLERPGEYGPDLLLAPVKPAGTESDRLYDYVKAIEKAKADNEVGRLLYVGATRAKRQLHLLGRAAWDSAAATLVAPHRRSLLAKLWPAVKDEFAAAVARALPSAVAAPAAGAVAVSSPPIRRLVSGWVLPDPPRAVAVEAAEAMVERHAPAFEWVGDTLRHVGTVVHRVLHQVAIEGLAAWDEAHAGARRPAFEAALRRLGVPRSELAGAAAAVERAVLNTLTDPRGRWILGEHDGAQSEYALSGLAGATLLSVRIDRTFVDDAGARWIVDFKTSTHAGGDLRAFLDNELERYREQMTRYAGLMGRLDSRPIRMGLYFPLLTAWREYEAVAAA